MSARRYVFVRSTEGRSIELWDAWVTEYVIDGDSWFVGFIRRMSLPPHRDEIVAEGPDRGTVRETAWRELEARAAAEARAHARKGA